MLTTEAASFYGSPTLILPASDAHQVRAAVKRLGREVKPKADERYVIVAFKRTEDT